MPTVGDLHEKAVAFLDAAVAALDWTDAGPPVRAYVNAGMPAMDCEQLVVWVEALGESLFRAGAGAESRAKAINRGGLAKATVRLQVIRCVPQPKLAGARLTWPDPTDLQAAAATIDADGWAIWLGLNDALKHGALSAECAGAERLGAEKLLPQGGFGGWNFAWRVPLEGGLLGT